MKKQSDKNLIVGYQYILEKALDRTGKKLTKEKKSKLMKEFLKYNYWEKLYYLYRYYQKNTYSTFKYCQQILSFSEKNFCEWLETTTDENIKKIIKESPDLIKIRNKIRNKVYQETNYKIRKNDPPLKIKLP